MRNSITSGKDYITHNMGPSSSEARKNLSCLGRFLLNKYVLLLAVVAVVLLCISPVLWTTPDLKPATTVKLWTSPSNIPSNAVATEAVPSSITHADTESLVVGNDMKSRLPQSVLIGVMKCGTRALQTFLNSHPDIVTTIEEVHYFDYNYEKGLEWFRRSMPLSGPTQITVERTPHYYKIAEVPRRIHDMNSSIKLILLVREPVERSMSNYLQYLTHNKHAESFENEVLLANGEVDPDSRFIINSDYNMHIDIWYKWFPKKQLKIIDGNLLTTDPYVVMRDLQEFLGVRQYIDQNSFKLDPVKGFYCFYNPNYTCLGSDKGRKHPPMRLEVKRKLYDYFMPRNKQFFDKIGQRFNWTINL